MSMRHPHPFSEQVLHVHIAVNYAPGLGVGIGIAQEKRYPENGEVISHWTFNKTVTRAWLYKDFEKQEVDTRETCQMRAFREGLGMVRALYKQRTRTSSTPLNLPKHLAEHADILPRRIVINCEKRLVVDLINHYLHHEINSHEAITSEKAKIMESIAGDVSKKAKDLRELQKIRAALGSIRRITECGAKVSIAKANPRHGAAVAAKRLARQVRAKICGGEDQASMG